jgi:hypothetical protein
LEKHQVQSPDPHDEPSVEWGWHGSFKYGAKLWGWFVFLLCLGMFIGNQTGHVEDIFLGLTALVVLFILLRNIQKRRTAWRR